MPISVRVITIIDQKYTVEMEIEEENFIELWNQLKGTPWGRRVLHLIMTMLPNYPEVEKKDEPEAKTETKTEENTTPEASGP